MQNWWTLDIAVSPARHFLLECYDDLFQSASTFYALAFSYNILACHKFNCVLQVTYSSCQDLVCSAQNFVCSSLNWCPRLIRNFLNNEQQMHSYSSRFNTMIASIFRIFVLYFLPQVISGIRIDLYLLNTPLYFYLQ